MTSVVSMYNYFTLLPTVLLLLVLLLILHFTIAIGLALFNKKNIKAVHESYAPTFMTFNSFKVSSINYKASSTVVLIV